VAKKAAYRTRQTPKGSEVILAMQAAVEQRGEIPVDVRRAVRLAARLHAQDPGSRRTMRAIVRARLSLQALGIGA
jgi:uncharacterized protein with von Willebrand factor type A (vWA) domain